MEPGKGCSSGGQKRWEMVQTVGEGLVRQGTPRGTWNLLRNSTRGARGGEHREPRAEAQGSLQASFPRGQPLCLGFNTRTRGGGGRGEGKQEEETTVYSYLENIFSLVFLTCELPAQNTPNTFLTPSNQINKWEERLLKTLTSSLSRKAVFHTRNLLSGP